LRAEVARQRWADSRGLHDRYIIDDDLKFNEIKRKFFWTQAENNLVQGAAYLTERFKTISST
jgi:hypothetical protein